MITNIVGATKEQLYEVESSTPVIKKTFNYGHEKLAIHFYQQGEYFVASNVPKSIAKRFVGHTWKVSPQKKAKEEVKEEAPKTFDSLEAEYDHLCEKNLKKDGEPRKDALDTEVKRIREIEAELA